MNQTSSNTPTTNCPLCNGSGWVFTDFNTVKECECGIREREIQESRLRFASIPEAYKDVRLSDMHYRYYTKQNSKNAFKAVAGFVKWYLENLDENIESGKGFYLWSDVKGSGKTMLAAAVANELIHTHNKNVKFATSIDILDEIKATYDSHEGDTESQLLEDLVTTEFLVIDDFGTERVSEWRGEKFYQIINKRYIGNKVTFFTSNYDLQTLKYDTRISNRIREKTYLVHFPEESCRETKAVKENIYDFGESEV